MEFGFLFDYYRAAVSKIPDNRKMNCSIPFVDFFHTALAMFTLKSSSLLHFKTRTTQADENIMRIFQISKIPLDTCFRKTLDKVDYTYFQNLFVEYWNLLKKEKIIKNRLVLNKFIAISIDGVEHYSSNKIHCEKCLSRKFKNGDILYTHSMLCAVNVHYNKSTVFPIGLEPIVKLDGNEKNDCEQNACFRLLDQLHENYGNQPFLIIEDSFYSRKPQVSKILSLGYSFIIGIKPDGNKHIFNAFENRKSNNKTFTYNCETKNKKNETIFYEWIKNVALNESSPEIRVNALRIIVKNNKNETTTFSWVTNLDVKLTNVEEIALIARSRWKIENETFNTLKNQGYEFEHNFGHGHNNLCSVLAHIMFFAFLIDQILQESNIIFQSIHKKLKSFNRFWEQIRAVLWYQPVLSHQHSLEIIVRFFKISSA